MFFGAKYRGKSNLCGLLFLYNKYFSRKTIDHKGGNSSLEFDIP